MNCATSSGAISSIGEAPLGPQEEPDHRLLDVRAHRLLELVMRHRARGHEHVAERHVALLLLLDRGEQRRFVAQPADQAQAPEIARHRIVRAIGRDRSFDEAQKAIFELEVDLQRARAPRVGDPLQQVGKRHRRKRAREHRA
jgi:hypothetical protein